MAGIHAVAALLREEPHRIHQIVLLRNSNNRRLYALQKEAKDKGVHAVQLPRARIDMLFAGAHQGVVATCHTFVPRTWEAFAGELKKDVDCGSNPLVVGVTGMEDARNLGACIRSAAGMDAWGFVFPAKGTAGLSPWALKAAAGNWERIRIAQMSRPGEALSQLADMGITIVGLDPKAESTLPQIDFRGPTLLLAGSESRGLPPFARKLCRNLARIPATSGFESYNASVAVSIALYEAARQRGFLPMDG